MSNMSMSRLAKPLRLMTLVSFASLAGAACGDETKTIASTNPDGGCSTDPNVVACSSADPGTLDLLDDMEDGNNQISMRQSRVGWWYTYHDETAGVLAPAPMTDVTMEAIPGGRCGKSQKAMRVTGSGFMNWGAGYGFDLNFDTTANTRVLYDATAAKGVTFWARVGDPSIKKIRLNVHDQWSDPAGKHCDETINSGPTSCYDAFGSDVILTTTWTRYTFKWAELAQRQFGIARDSLDVANLTQIHWDIPPSSPVFDIWIDDVAFVQ